MIDSLHNIKRNFFQLFLGADGENFLRNYVSVTDIDGNEVLQVPFNYYKRSTDDYSEATYEKYPILSVTDYLPLPVDGWNNYPQPRYAGQIRNEDGNVIGIYKYPAPVRLMCRYDIHIAAKKESEFIAMMNYLYGKFGMSNDEVLQFNLQELAGHEVCDFVKYKVRTVSDVPRREGVFEALFPIELFLWADIRPLTHHATLVETVTVNYNEPVIIQNINNIYKLGIDVKEKSYG